MLVTVLSGIRSEAAARFSAALPAAETDGVALRTNVALLCVLFILPLYDYVLQRNEAFLSWSFIFGVTLFTKKISPKLLGL